MIVRHIYPEGDLIQHTDNECVCGPTPEPTRREDGVVGWRFVHHSLDGREKPCPGCGKPVGSRNARYGACRDCAGKVDQ